MTTATPTSPAQDAAASSVQQPPANDPTKDIDAKTTVIVLVIATIFVFGTVWALYPLFAWAMFEERVTTYEEAPNTQRLELNKQEVEMLKAGDGRISIEQSMRELSTK